MKAFFFGAGASRGTFKFDVFPVPAAAEFGKTLTRLYPKWTRTKEYSELFKIVTHLGRKPGDWSLEEVWSCDDYYAKLKDALPSPVPWDSVTKDMKKALLAVYGSRCDKHAMKARKDSTLAVLLQDKVSPGDVLISFNYDTIVENLAKRLKLKLHPVGETPSVYGNGTVTFAKPHGSVSWIMNFNPDRSVEVKWKSGDDLLLKSLPDVSLNSEPLLLGTVPIKSELIKELQIGLRSPGVFDAVVAQWRRVVEAIRDAETIFVVGYSFPPEDQYGRFLVQEGLRWRKRERKPKLRIEFFEIEDKEAERAKELSSVFCGHIRELVFRGRVLPRESRKSISMV